MGVRFFRSYRGEDINLADIVCTSLEVNGTITLANDETISNTTDNIITFVGKLAVGSQATAHDVSATREYGAEFHYSGNDYHVTALRARGQLVTTDADDKHCYGAMLQAANNNGIDADVLNGAVIEAVGKSTTTAATIDYMRGAIINTEWSAKDTVGTLQTLYVRTHTRDAATEGYISGTGYLLYLENEAVGGNGQVLDAGIYLKQTNLSGGNNAFTYGIDLSGAAGKIATADIRLGYGETIDNLTDGTINIGGNLKVTENSNYIQLTHDGTDAYLKTDDGNVIVTTDEATNSHMYLEIKPKGTANAFVHVWDRDATNKLVIAQQDGASLISSATGDPLNLQQSSSDSCTYFLATAGNPALTIYGYITAGTATRFTNLQMSDTNDEFLIQAENNANHEGVTISLPEANQKFRIRDASAESVAIYTGGIIDLSGQTITTVNASGSVDITDWTDQIVAEGAETRDPKYAVVIKVAGTDYYIPAFTSA